MVDKVVLGISGRPRKVVKENITYLVDTIPQKINSERIKAFFTINWACEPDSDAKGFLNQFATNLGTGEVMFDAIFTGFKKPRI